MENASKGSCENEAVKSAVEEERIGTWALALKAQLISDS
jgi:hypothetical protein